MDSTTLMNFSIHGLEREKEGRKGTHENDDKSNL